MRRRQGEPLSGDDRCGTNEKETVKARDGGEDVQGRGIRGEPMSQGESPTGKQFGDSGQNRGQQMEPSSIPHSVINTCGSLGAVPTFQSFHVPARKTETLKPY